MEDPYFWPLTAWKLLNNLISIKFKMDDYIGDATPCANFLHLAGACPRIVKVVTRGVYFYLICSPALTVNAKF